MNEIKFDPETIFQPSVKADLAEFAEWLVARGYSVNGDEDESWGFNSPIGSDGDHPIYARRKLKDDFLILVSLDGETRPGKPISGLENLTVKSIYTPELSIWEACRERWLGPKEAAAFVEKAEPIARRQAARQSMRRCPECPTRTKGYRGRGILQRAHSGIGWECWMDKCNFKWGRAELPLSLVSRGRARIQFGQKCKECKQPMVWFAGSNVLRCSMSPGCKFTASAPKALAERLMKA